MTHPLIDRLTDEFGYPFLKNAAELAAFTEAPGHHVIFIPGDPKRSLETPDVAVILPELRLAFQGRFDCAVVSDEVGSKVRQATGIHKTPSLIFYNTGTCIGGIPKVRDWSDYVERITHLLAQPIAAE